METQEMTTNKAPVTFAAIDPYLQRNIPSPKESASTGSERIRWGDRDRFPLYLCGLYDNVTTLRSVIDGCVDYIAGDEVRFNGDAKNAINKKGENATKVVRKAGKDIETFGGCALQVIRDVNGVPAYVSVIPLQYLRSNKDNTLFYYGEKFGTSAASDKIVTLPAFMPNLNWSELDETQRKFHSKSILLIKGETITTYPTPCYLAALKACEMERSVDDYHINAIDNGFAASALINFNSGKPTDEIKEEVERNFCEKFSGHSNAGRIAFSWNPAKENATTVTPIKTEDFGDRYNAAEKNSRQKIFTAFRANPNLFGIPTESLGFSSEEYRDAFLLFNRTHVQPIQQRIIDAFTTIFGVEVLEITPFSLVENDTVDALAVQLGVGGTQSMLSVLESESLSYQQKRGALRVLFGLDDDSINELLGTPAPAVKSE